jgi:Holliday junction resolvase RusA-like endonuclease
MREFLTTAGEPRLSYSSEPPRAIRFTVLGEPKSKERPRFSNGRAYTPQATLDAEKLVADTFKAAMAMQNKDEYPYFTRPLGVSIQFFNGNRRRRDLDNMAKLVLDALNKLAYEDDYLIEELFVHKYFTTKENARSIIWLYDLDK